MLLPTSEPEESAKTRYGPAKKKRRPGQQADDADAAKIISKLRAACGAEGQSKALKR